MTDNRWITKKELAQYLGIGLSTVERYVAQGTLPPGHKVGNTLRWKLSVVDKWIHTTDYERECVKLKQKIDEAYLR